MLSHSCYAYLQTASNRGYTGLYELTLDRKTKPDTNESYYICGASPRLERHV